MNERLPSLSGLLDTRLEPLYRAAIAVASVAALVLLLIEPLFSVLLSFGVQLTPAQVESLSALVRALAGLGAPLAVAALARPQVSSPATVQDILTGPGGTPAGPDFEITDPPDGA